ncbi:PadR family transcriptional regulator [Methylicorpusculum oleiharenae]|uniref:PadR family transcriptional regulator n=1 Tax=Methylicorpusculum oleiharenae TaxID=1338687 RepID=UPI00135C3055|nr:PadR family transcriptional regulator [Methylicorpusculum oleiharenae]MCD2453784.1 PadR family transcriptional regulator [Methylicorpusculum oleiharenae]
MKNNEVKDKPVSMGDLERFILLAIINNHNNSYGVEIRREIKEKIGKDVSVGALYTTLDRIETKGLVKSKAGEATEERSGRQKKYFQVTALGQNSLNQSLREIALMANVNPIAI